MKYFLPKIRKETKILDCTTYFKHLLEVLSSAITHTHTHERTHTHTHIHTQRAHRLEIKVQNCLLLLLLFSFLHNYLCRKSNGILKKKKSKTNRNSKNVKKEKVKQKILKLLGEFSKFAVSNRQKSNLGLYTTKEQWEAETLKNQLN